VLDMCVENFMIANPLERGPYYGISGYWCWIRPEYSIERYTSEYIFVFASAGFSFILYLFVFLRLRGNVTVSAGWKVYFQQRPKVRLGRTSGGAYISTDDRRLESQVTTVAKQMLWYPLVYTILVLPMGAARYCTNSGIPVSFPAITATAALFMLGGFVNTVLFCATRNVLPGCGRQRFSIGTKLYNRGGDITLSTWGNSPWRRTEPGTRKGTVGAGRSSFVIDISVEKDIEIRYDDGPNPSSLKFGPPTTLTSPSQAYNGRQRTDAYSYHIRQPSIPPIQDERSSVFLEVDGENEESYLNNGVYHARKPNAVDAVMLPHPLYPSRRRERGIPDPAMDLEPPASVHPFSMAAPSNTDTRQFCPPSILTLGTAVGHAHLSGASSDFGDNSGGTYWTGYNERLPQAPYTIA
jgi:hypothetical protein